MLRLAAAAISVLLLFSCAEEQFSVSSLSLDMEREVSVASSGDSSEHNTLYVSASFSSPDNVYTFRLVSPDGDLSWEGAFPGSGSSRTSDPAEITDGAVFPEGEYSIMIYSDNGTEVSDTITLSYDSVFRTFISGELSGSAFVTEYAADGSVIDAGERAEGYRASPEASSALIEYTDSRGNDVNLSQSFLP